MSNNDKEFRMTGKQRFLKAVELPLTCVGKSVKATLSDNVRAEIEGILGIVEYDENVVRLKAAKYVLTIIGRDLRIIEYSEALTVVEGLINTVSYEAGRAEL